MTQDRQDHLADPTQKPNEPEALDNLADATSQAHNGNGHSAAPEASAEKAAEEAKSGLAAETGGNGDGYFDDSHFEVEESAKKSKLFSRRKNANAELEKLKAAHDKLVSEHDSLKDRYLRLAAEMDNFRKRTDRDFYNRLQNAFANLIAELLPIIDDLERPLNAKDETKDYNSLLNGMLLIYQKFVKILEDRGVKPMATVGTEFNPVFHQALSAKAVEGKPAGVVVEELQRGYTFNERVLRPAQVIVSREKTDSGNEAV